MSETFEYRIHKGWRIVIYLAAPAMILVFAGLLVMTVAGRDEQLLKIYWLLVPVCIAMILLAGVGLLDAIKSRLWLDDSGIIAESALRRQELMSHEIKGYTVADKYIFIHPDNTRLKKIKISTYVEKRSEIERWLADRYPDLDMLEAEREQAEILSNNDFGGSTRERAKKLESARKRARILNWTGTGIGLWAIFYPQPYDYLLLATMIIPVVCIVVLQRSGGLIRLEEKKGTSYPSVLTGIFMPAVALFLRSLLDYNIFDYSKLWVPLIVMALIAGLAAAVADKKRTGKGMNYYAAIVACCLTFVYCFGAALFVNCRFDPSAPRQYTATVLSKRISSGKTTSYYVELSPWGPQVTSGEVNISKSLYTLLGENREVKIYFLEGRLGIPWFVVER
ncbi:MAG: hypothetical protein KF746_27240 [Chitinophagaceae bacterium]|nr:hypothetical protein [Chitinophagaceae bacterium]